MITAQMNTLSVWVDAGTGEVVKHTVGGYATMGVRNLFIAGTFYGTVDFGGEMLVSAGNNDIFIAEFDAIGRHIWI